MIQLPLSVLSRDLVGDMPVFMSTVLHNEFRPITLYKFFSPEWDECFYTRNIHREA